MMTEIRHMGSQPCQGDGVAINIFDIKIHEASLVSNTLLYGYTVAGKVTVHNFMGTGWP